MKVKFLVSLASVDRGSYAPGEIADIDEKWAEQLLLGGLVETVKASAKQKTVKETATLGQ